MHFMVSTVFLDATGGVYKKQGHNHCDLLKRDY